MCAQVITWLQTLTVASVLVNMFLAGIIAVLVVELRKEMNARRPAEEIPAKLAMLAPSSFWQRALAKMKT